MRILHLLDPASCADEGLLACAAALAIDADHECWLIASGPDERRAWELGIHSTDRVTPRPRPMLIRDPTVAALKHLHAARPANAPDLIQCWSPGALHLARRVFGACPGAPARCAVALRPPTRRQLSTPADSDLATGREVAVAFDEPTRAALAPLLSRAGPADAARWRPTIRLLHPPAFAPGGPIALDRAALRASLNIAPSDTVVCLLADPPALGDAARMTFAAGVVLAAGHRTVSLIRRDTINDRRAARYTRAHSRRWGLILADLSLPELLGASDIALIDAPSGVPTCGPVAASLALSMAVPIVTFPGVLPGWPVLRAPSDALGRIAVPIVELLESPHLRADLAARARSWSDHARASNAFPETLAAIWREQLNIPAPSALHAVP